MMDKVTVSNQLVVFSTDANGTDATQYKIVTPDMVPGLTMGADYYEVGNSISTVSQELTAGTMYAKYAVGN